MSNKNYQSEFKVCSNLRIASLYSLSTISFTSVIESLNKAEDGQSPQQEEEVFYMQYYLHLFVG